MASSYRPKFRCHDEDVDYDHLVSLLKRHNLYQPNMSVSEMCQVIHEHNLRLNNLEILPVLPLVQIDNLTIKEITCGLVLNRYYKISSLLCAALSSKDITEVLDGYECTSMGQIMASNIIRVAAKRIFFDPLRCFVEPVSNSIDSYREQKGQLSIGKFGLGFFSLLSWLNNDFTFLTIESTYIDSNEQLCSWKAHIILHDNDYYFTVTDSNKYLEQQTGTRITITNIPYSPDLLNLETLFRKTFTEITDILIVYNNTILNHHSFNSEERNKLPAVEISLRTYVDITKMQVLSFEDTASGISLDDLFQKLLIPTMSTKTIQKFTERSKDEYTLPSRVRDGRVINIYDKSIRSTLLITVGNIGIYCEVLRDSKNNIAQTYIWALPANSPMPVSRDDIVFNDPHFYTVAFQSLCNLVDQIVIDPSLSLTDLYTLLNMYAAYSNDPHVFRLITDISTYIESKDNVYTYPANANISFLIDYISSLSGEPIFFVESSVPNIPRCIDFMWNICPNKDDTRFPGLKVIFIPQLYKTTGYYSTDSNLPHIMFVDEALKDNPELLMKSADLILTVRAPNLLLNSLTDYHVIPPNRPFSEFYQECLTDWDTIVYKNKYYRDQYENLILNVLITITRRPIHEHDVIPQTYTYFTSSNLSYTLFGFHRTKLRNISSIKYLLNYAMIYFNLLKISTSATIHIYNPLNGCFLHTIPNDSQSISLLLAEDPIYAHYISYLIQLYKNVDNRVALVKYILTELKTHYTQDILLYGLRTIHITTPESEFLNIIHDLKLSVNVFLEIRTDTDYKISNLIEYEQFPSGVYNFTALQLIYYIFEHNEIRLDEVNITHPEINKPPFQALQIAVNDGTSKSYIEAIITELTQNSTDASRQYIANKVIQCKLIDNKTLVTLDRGDVPFVTPISTKVQQTPVPIEEYKSPFHYSYDTDEFDFEDDFVDDGYWSEIYPDLWVPIQDAVEYERNPEKYYTQHAKNNIMESLSEISEAEEPVDLTQVKVCPSILNFKIGLHERTDELVLVMTDYIGIPLKGMIALMIPFLSTKTSDQSLTTGEMGSGFMNVYRQPGTRYVTIHTRDPDTGYLYQLKAVPMVNRYNRVYDIDYQLKIFPQSSLDAHTQICVYMNYDYVDAGHYITEALLYTYKYYPSLSWHTYVNDIFTPKEKIVLCSTELGTVYRLKTTVPVHSVILTNGVPHGNLTSIVQSIFSDDPYWIDDALSYNLILNLNKDTYQPVQSRKHLIQTPEIIASLKVLLLYAACNNVYYRLEQELSEQEAIKDPPYSFSSDLTALIPGLNYSGPVSQVISLHKSENSLLNPFETAIPTLNVPALHDIVRSVWILSQANENATIKELVHIYEEELNVVVNSHYIRAVEAWFSNKNTSIIAVKRKKIEEDEYLSYYKINIKAKEEQTIDPIVIHYAQDCVNQAWREIYELGKAGDLIGFNLVDDPPVVKFDIEGKLVGLGGQYDSRNHVIMLSMMDDSTEWNVLASQLIIYDRLYRTNPVRALEFIKMSPEISNFSGIKNRAVTLAHEFGHALRREGHGSMSSHADFQYTYMGLVYRVPFMTGCNILWKLGLMKYRPTFVES